MTKPLILVTGGAGFIGSNIVAQLASVQGFDTAVCDRLREAALGKWRNLAKHSIADFVSPDDLWSWLATHRDEVSIIIHMGAVSSTTEADADKIVQTNFGLSRDLWRWCAEHGRRFIYASSAATYGDGALGFDDCPDLEFLTSLRPLNAYGWSKALFDAFAARQADRGLAPSQWAGLKFFNVYGPNEEHKGAMRSMVSRIWPDVEAGRPVKLFRSYREDYADGGQLRDFVYVADVADVVGWLTSQPGVSGLFNLGSGQARSFKDLASAVFAARGREARIDFVDMPAAIRGTYQYFTQARTDRLRAAGYRGALTSLEEGVTEYVNGWLSRPDPYR